MSVKGFFDGIIGRTAYGWALNEVSSTARCTVTLLFENVPVCTVVADGFRQDLAQAGIGDGWHSFHIEIPNSIEIDHYKNLDIADESGKLFPRNFDKEQIAKIVRNGLYSFDQFLFDESYYISQGGNVKLPLEHFKRFGWQKGLNAHPLLSSDYYIEHLKRPLSSDPLTDFLEAGQFEYAEVHPLFDVKGYCTQRPDVAASGIHPLVHYIMNGYNEGVKAFRFFDEDFYRSDFNELDFKSMPPICHYIQFGFKENRSPAKNFSPTLFARLSGLDKKFEPLSELVKASYSREVSKNPVISVIILNLNKSLMTMQCLYFLHRNSSYKDMEFIVVDNGSFSQDLKQLVENSFGCRVIHLQHNAGFGEANNIGVEAASGEFILLLNNDAFIGKNCIPPLLEKLQKNPEIGATAPMFLYPDGRLQEAGGNVFADGTAHQFGKGLSADSPMFNIEREVTYSSAAALLIRKKLFQDVLGFDLCWDPAYYEDTDLCLKIALRGSKICYVPTSKVVHLENATSSDNSLSLKLHNIVELNRVKFVQRWGDWLNKQDSSAPNLFPENKPAVIKGEAPQIALYTPYPLTPGGGERYLLSIASLLRNEAIFTLVTPDFCSKIRIQTLARELGLCLNNLRIKRYAEIGAMGQVDFLVAMGNEVMPNIPGFARNNIFHCQYPFPPDISLYARDWGKRGSYQSVVVNSDFTARAYSEAQEKLNLGDIRIEVINPPVPNMKIGSTYDSNVMRILHVGRFFAGGHCKRQDVMVSEFRLLLSQVTTPVELHFVGSVGSDASAREYLLKVKDQASDLPIEFHINASPEKLKSLYGSCAIYWHLTGVNDNITLRPERFEHFGITIAEAMSAGLIPVVLKHGGPAEIVADGVSGFLVSSGAELRKKTIEVINLKKDKLELMSLAAMKRAENFSEERFGDRWRSLFHL